MTSPVIEYSFEDLADSPLVPGAIYKGALGGGYGADPISKLLGVSNSGGFRISGTFADTDFVVLYSSGSDAVWTDGFYGADNPFVYYGDNRTPGSDIHATPKHGNSILRRAFDDATLGHRGRKLVPLFLIFTKAGTGSDVRFEGLGVPDPDRLQKGEALEKIVQTSEKGEFENYRAYFHLIRPSAIDKNWLIGAKTGFRDDELAPEEYLSWQIGEPKNLIVDVAETEETSALVTRSDNHGFAEEKQLELRPSTAMLDIFEGMKYNAWFALGEFIDNSITSYVSTLRVGMRASGLREKLRVEIKWDRETETIIIEDNAAGIPNTPGGWERVLQVGARNPDPNHLGVYGYGLKAAALWWSPRFKIESKVAGENVLRWAEIDRNRIGERLYTPLHEVEASSDLHFTRVTLIGLNKKKSIPYGLTVRKIKDYLASMYRVYLRGDHPEYSLPGNVPFLELIVQGESLTAPVNEILTSQYWASPDELPSGEAVYWKREDIEIHVPAEDLPEEYRVIRGWVGLLAKGRPNDAGFFMMFRGKGVVGIGEGVGSNEDLYRPTELVGSGNTNRRQRFIGEFDISAFGKSITTDDIGWSSEEESYFLARLREILKDDQLPLWQMAENWRPSKIEELRRRDRDVYEDAVTSAVEAATLEAASPTLKSDSQTQQAESLTSFPEVSSPNSFKREFLWEGSEVVFEGVLDLEHREWLSIFKSESTMHVVLNLNHPFMRAFAYVPGKDPDSIIRLALVIAMAEINNQRDIRGQINTFLNGPLGTTKWGERDY